MPKAEYRNAVRSRRLIIRALADLLQEKPLDKITVTDVVTRADINRGTFYAHFENIPHVIDCMIAEAFCRLRDSITSVGGRWQDIPALLLGQLQALIEEDMDFYSKVLASSAAPTLQARLCDIMLDYLLEHEVDHPIGSHGEYVLTTRFCAAGVGALYLDWFAGRLPVSFDQLTVMAQQLLERTLGIKAD